MVGSNYSLLTTRCPLLFSLGPERFNRVHPQRASERDERCDDRGQADDRCGGDERYGIGWLHAEQDAGHQLGEGERRNAAERRSDQRETSNATEHESRDMRTLGTQGKPDAKLS